MICGQYAAVGVGVGVGVGAGAGSGLADAVVALKEALVSGVDVSELLGRIESRKQNAAAYVSAYRNYSAPTDGLEGVQLAPLQLLASEGINHSGRDH